MSATTKSERKQNKKEQKPTKTKTKRPFLLEKFERSALTKQSIPQDKMATILDEWKALKQHHEAQLAIANKKIEELQAAGVEPPLSQAEMKKRVLDIEERKAYKSSWKKAIKDGLLENIQSIMNEDTYDAYLDVHVADDATEEEKKAAKERSKKIRAYLGPFGSRKWQLFVLKVIQFLHSEGSFHSDEGGFDTYEDTAGGCDEIAWDAGVEIIEKEVN